MEGQRKGTELGVLRPRHTPFDPTTDRFRHPFETSFEIVGPVRSHPDGQMASTLHPFLFHLLTKRDPDHCPIGPVRGIFSLSSLVIFA